VNAKTNALLQLPANIAGRADIGRLLRELEALGSYMDSAGIKEPGGKPKLPKTSQLLDEILQQNNLNASHGDDRLILENFLKKAKTEAPLIHISFSADPPPAFTNKLVTWLRREIHPMVLLQIGLQPGIGAGCVLRTANKQFDLSLRQHFVNQREMLISKLHEALSPVVPSPAQPAAEETN